MKIHSQKGFTLLELAIGIALVSVITLGAMTVTHQIISITGSTQMKLAPISQVESAAYWIARDAQVAENIVTDDLGADEFVFTSWTEWVLGGSSIQHSVTYYFDDVSNGIGNLMRLHWSSAGANDTTLVAQGIHHKTGNPISVSSATYVNPALTLSITCSLAGVMETREFTVFRRPNFNW